MNMIFYSINWPIGVSVAPLEKQLEFIARPQINFDYKS